MRRLLSLTAVTALAFGAPAARADSARADCGFDTYALPGSTMNKGILYGSIVSPGEDVSIRCSLRLQGVEVATTPTSTGTTAAVTMAWAEYDGTDPALCIEYTAGATHNDYCVAIDVAQIPPQEVCDLTVDVCRQVRS